ncbi:MAG: hypothetical protein UU23_C0003G0002 [Candidatus Curtissbacteria bacterium GW2011_GWA1_40_9]|uniref:Uncharacterized protein n=1 Tax=Candidatus Curtissbacteria bacterium GW2011_GWA1_40_9 TaxID=1618408 RepID=A0A0G0TM70_9BACT|nr:MAG: hypothetical protein UU23_C0003G0002 [Candidatus Curtissbacteria bacterium GW2011_GWA1_40_9]
MVSPERVDVFEGDGRRKNGSAFLSEIFPAPDITLRTQEEIEHIQRMIQIKKARLGTHSDVEGLEDLQRYMKRCGLATETSKSCRA